MRAAASLLAEKAVANAKHTASQAVAAPTKSAFKPGGGSAAQPDKSTLDGALHVAEKVAAGVGLLPVRIGASVGRGGKNDSDDVETVQARLVFLGYAPGSGMEGLINAIEQYQP